MDALLLLLPLVLLQIGLIVIALVDLSKRRTVRGGRKWLWALIIVGLGLLGPVLYFILGRKD